MTDPLAQAVSIMEEFGKKNGQGSGKLQDNEDEKDDRDSDDGGRTPRERAETLLEGWREVLTMSYRKFEIHCSFIRT